MINSIGKSIKEAIQMESSQILNTISISIWWCRYYIQGLFNVQFYTICVVLNPFWAVLKKILYSSKIIFVVKNEKRDDDNNVKWANCSNLDSSKLQHICRCLKEPFGLTKADGYKNFGIYSWVDLEQVYIRLESNH